ncbi:hypothetical protein Gdia_0657 [Gluconacetobacter diazotrophicus PA1 5]|uniref:glycosyltransferase family 32 protein n=1 Tax=Gluconacetobacter diazotrophicus TaxID=33996 RepID=UPI000173AF1F|nr:glycosyltransferase [Gluconacetobacter diazotrophicus]ACI50448.1 hypothetical protein Gdia_0657 [Gluconacetobacter diazotrophicus PA1 5]TWA98321.1 glycosyl transferase-like sugar-binding protein [Gluconacetobacter diazotrophicus]
MSEFHSISYLHQVLIVDGLGLPEKIPLAVQKNIDAARKIYPEAEYILWSGESLRDFIRSNFDGEVLAAFDLLVPYAYKCDLARFCLMYIYGGIYFDLSNKLLNYWKIPKHFGVAAFTEMYPGMESWTCVQTNLLWSLPGRPEWERAINGIVRNCKERFYGIHDHYPTAGALLGRSFAAAMADKGQRFEADDQFMGEVRYVTPERQPQNVTFITPDRNLVCIRNKAVAGDISELGLSGVNSYVRLWASKCVYGETDHWKWYPGEIKIHAEDCAILTSTGLTAKKGAHGRFMYGPFADLEAGSYEVMFKFSDDTKFSRVFLDVSANYGSKIIKEYDERHDDIINKNSVKFSFDISSPHQYVEFRMSVFGDFSGELHHISLDRTDRVFDFSDPNIQTINVKREKHGIVIPVGSEGRIMYGPYIGLEAGYYKLEAYFDSDLFADYIEIEICAGGGNNVISKIVKKNIKNYIEFNFELACSYLDIEFRVSVGPMFNGIFHKFVLYKHDNNVELNTYNISDKENEVPGILRKLFGLRHAVT